MLKRIFFLVIIVNLSIVTIICCINKHEEKINKQTEINILKPIVSTRGILIKEIEATKEEVEVEPVFYLSENERSIVECIVMGESGGEPYSGQVLVAQCILNACLKDNLQPSEVRKKYQYTGWNEEVSDQVKEVVSDVFDNGYKVTDEYILYFYAPKYTNSSWHESQKFVIEIGGHRFFAEYDEVTK